jgi:isoleucyl-tRNA synthetase
VQNLRREKGFEIEETVSVTILGLPRIVTLLEGPWGEYFRTEVLAHELELSVTDSGDGEYDSIRLDGEELLVNIKRLGKVGLG